MSSSTLLDNLIESLQVMPGVGPVSATRIAYYLLDRKRQEGLNMAQIIEQSLKNISLCPHCRNYTGNYFVLHGHLSPLDGIGPKELGLDVLRSRLETEDVKELILALSQTVEGDVTASYIASMAKKYGITVSRIATGVPLGGDLGSVDGNTLAMSFNYRRNM